MSQAAQTQKAKGLKVMDQRVQPEQFEPEARRQAAVVLEVLAGVRTGPQGAATLGMSLQGYLELERRAIRGLLVACSRSRGRPNVAEVRVRELEATVGRLEAQVRRHQALLRAAQRGIGLALPPAAAPAPARPGAAKRKSKRPTVRALRVVDMLRQPDRAAAAATAATASSSSSPPTPQPAMPLITSTAASGGGGGGGPVAPAG